MYPTDRQWALFDRYKNCPPPMSPQTFLQRWDLDYPDLARLLNINRNTVRHWFSTGSGSRPAPEQYRRRLATIDFFWRNSDRIPQDLLDEWCGLAADDNNAEAEPP
ncbi:hypothetical protein [Leptolyngbya ohadii]|uniref:hypothetical protein n=1 Tax=Leptolyngbya ohadii TaxID=1962290 RepID=UPI000B5A21DE|nr:hypothetical protein [Leptolyngbya ohadii]